MTEAEIDKALDDSNIWVRIDAIRNPNATEANIDKALSDGDQYIRKAAATHPNASPANIDKALDDNSFAVKIIAANHKNATEATIDKALNSNILSVINNAICNPAITANNLRKAFKNGNKYIKFIILTRKNIDENILLNVFSMRNFADLKLKALHHENVTEKVLQKAIKSKTLEVKIAVLNHKKVNDKIKKIAARDKDLSAYLLTI